MAITSVKIKHPLLFFKSVQFRYAVLYVVITFVALLFLNIYCAETSRDMFFKNKETSMIEKCKLASGDIAELDALNTKTVAQAVSGFEDLNVTRLIITDQNAQAIYDSNETLCVVDKFIMFPEILEALAGNDVFHASYHDSMLKSVAATPVYAYGTLIGCVYMTDYDTEQGNLIGVLQNSIFIITLILEAVVIMFSLAFSSTYSRRLYKIMASIRKVRQGDYSHKLEMRGHDELNALSNEFNDLISRLQISEKKRSQFVSDASHELKTPLASIKLLTDSILQNAMDGDTIREFVTDIGNEADRLNRMSQKLLTLSRIEDQLENEFSITYISPTIKRVVRMLSQIANDLEIEIILNLENDCPILIYEDDLYQIIFNIVENGIKYNTKGGTLTITLNRSEDNAIICIRDTGVGIPKDSLEHIFERFYRVDKARSRSTGGSGLGLSIVRNMVERNQGTISVESNMGNGTAFTLSFPVFDTEVPAE